MNSVNWTLFFPSEPTNQRASFQTDQNERLDQWIKIFENRSGKNRDKQWISESTYFSNITFQQLFKKSTDPINFSLKPFCIVRVISMLTSRAGFATSPPFKQKTNTRICSSALNTLNGEDLKHAVAENSEVGISPLIAKVKF